MPSHTMRVLERHASLREYDLWERRVTDWVAGKYDVRRRMLRRPQLALDVWRCAIDDHAADNISDRHDAYEADEH